MPGTIRVGGAAAAAVMGMVAGAGGSLTNGR